MHLAGSWQLQLWYPLRTFHSHSLGCCTKAIPITARSQLQVVQHITSHEPEEYFSNQFNH